MSSQHFLARRGKIQKTIRKNLWIAVNKLSPEAQDYYRRTVSFVNSYRDPYSSEDSVGFTSPDVIVIKHIFYRRLIFLENTKKFKADTNKTVFEDERDLLLPLQEEGDTIEEMHYEGCPRHRMPIAPSSEDPFTL